MKDGIFLLSHSPITAACINCRSRRPKRMRAGARTIAPLACALIATFRRNAPVRCGAFADERRIAAGDVGGRAYRPTGASRGRVARHGHSQAGARTNNRACTTAGSPPFRCEYSPVSGASCEAKNRQKVDCGKRSTFRMPVSIGSRSKKRRWFSRANPTYSASTIATMNWYTGIARVCVAGMAFLIRIPSSGSHCHIVVSDADSGKWRLKNRLPNPERRNPHRWRYRVLWRHGRQLLCGEREQPSAAMGPETGWRDRRRGNYLHGQWFAKGGCGSGPRYFTFPTKIATAKIVILGLGATLNEFLGTHKSLFAYITLHDEKIRPAEFTGY